ncbi:MAG TPA: J domain-containing protein [Vicinamibacteria bacterium]|nr:J domain-containing protein [Vicinamibacteria bacterium]
MDLYEILCVRRDAKPAEVRRAYQKLARLLHPDVNPGDPAAAERFEAVSQAFEILADAERRARYDRGETPPPPAPTVPEVGFQGFDFAAEVRVGSADFREIFDGVLKPAPASVPGSSRGEDLEQATRVTFEEAFHGTKRRVHLVRQERCQACEGRGQVVLGSRPCPKCEGSGQVRTSRGRMIFTRRCTACDATGNLGRRPCSRCGGEGRTIQSEWLEVQIPPGVGQGNQVRLSGCGNAGRLGGHPGDFVLDIESEPHAFYKREGQDLACQIPITMVEAALGAHVEVPTPDGPVTIEIPAGTQAGQRFRLRKRGMPKLGEKGRGDLWVEVRVWVPAVDDDPSRELLREFARRNPDDPRRGLIQGPAPEVKR